MTNEQIEQVLIQLSEALSAVTQQVVSLANQQSVIPQYRVSLLAESAALQARVDAIRKSLPSNGETAHFQTDVR
jgi:small-conductance mechanosensitive channel